MRILLLIDRYLPNPLSSAKMFQDLATEMSSLGNDVTIVTGDDSLQTRFEVSREVDITIVRVKSGAFRHPSRFVRGFNEIFLSRRIWNSAHSFFKSQSYDLVVCYSPTIFWSGLLKKIKAINDCTIYLVLRDIFPQWALDTGLLSRYGLIYWYFRIHEIRLYESVDFIGVQSPANLNYFLNSSLNGRYKLEVLYNWTKIQDHKLVLSEFRSKLGLEGKVIFMYGGNMGVAQDIDNILRLATNLKNENNIFFILVGDGSEFKRLKILIDKNGFSNIKIFPAVSQIEYEKILAECDVGLITLRRDFKTHNIPGKLLSYLELRKPILASINIGNDLDTIIQDYNTGLVCINGDDDLLAECARKLSYDQNLRIGMGNNGHRLLSEKFSVLSAAKQILSHFSKN